MPPKDLSGELGSGNDNIDFNFPPPSEEEWKKIDAGVGLEPQKKIEPEPEPEIEEPAEPDAERPQTDSPDDPEIELPDGTKLKLSEINALRAGKAPAAPQQTEAQRVAQERQRFEKEREEFKALQEQHRQGIQEILKDPKKYAELQKAAGVNLEPHPVSQQQQWVQFRFNQYLNAGWKPEEVTREKLLGDLVQAQTIVNGREIAEMRHQVETQKREVADRKSYDSVVKELEGLYARPEFAYAATPEGRDIVDALLAQADRDGTDISLAEVVRKAHEFGARLVKGYVGVKRGQAKDTGKLMRAGGSHRAPEPKEYGSGWDGFNKIARDRIKNGGA